MRVVHKVGQLYIVKTCVRCVNTPNAHFIHLTNATPLAIPVYAHLCWFRISFLPDLRCPYTAPHSKAMAQVLFVYTVDTLLCVTLMPSTETITWTKRPPNCLLHQFAVFCVVRIFSCTTSLVPCCTTPIFLTAYGTLHNALFMWPKALLHYVIQWCTVLHSA